MFFIRDFKIEALGVFSWEISVPPLLSSDEEAMAAAMAACIVFSWVVFLLFILFIENWKKNKWKKGKRKKEKGKRKTLKNVSQILKNKLSTIIEIK